MCTTGVLSQPHQADWKVKIEKFQAARCAGKISIFASQTSRLCCKPSIMQRTKQKAQCQTQRVLVQVLDNMVWQHLINKTNKRATMESPSFQLLAIPLMPYEHETIRYEHAMHVAITKILPPYTECFLPCITPSSSPCPEKNGSEWCCKWKNRLPPVLRLEAFFGRHDTIRYSNLTEKMSRHWPTLQLLICMTFWLSVLLKPMR